jgi:hypothetical protein
MNSQTDDATPETSRGVMAAGDAEVQRLVVEQHEMEAARADEILALIRETVREEQRMTAREQLFRMLLATVGVMLIGVVVLTMLLR